MVIPGGVTCDNEFTTVKVNRDHLDIDVSVYLDAIVGANNGKGATVLSENTKIRKLKVIYFHHKKVLKK